MTGARPPLATQAELDAEIALRSAADALKANQAEFDSHVVNYVNPHAVTKAQVGLAGADNTSDVNKPVSTAIQTALDAKQALDADLTAISALVAPNDALIQRKADVWTNRTPAQVKADLALAQADVGLGNVDNTSDVNKPVSAAQAALLAAKDDPRFSDSVFDRPIPGSWLVPGGSVTTLALIATTQYFGCWIYVFAETPVDRIGFEVTTAGAAGDAFRLALYRKVKGTAQLNRVVAETADLAVSSLGLMEATIQQTLTPGRYLGLVRPVVVTGSPAIRARLLHSAAPALYPTDVTELGGDPRGGVYATQLSVGSGVFPESLELGLGSRSVAPLIYLRAS